MKIDPKGSLAYFPSPSSLWWKHNESRNFLCLLMYPSTYNVAMFSQALNEQMNNPLPHCTLCSALLPLTPVRSFRWLKVQSEWTWSFEYFPLPLYLLPSLPHFLLFLSSCYLSSSPLGIHSIRASAFFWVSLRAVLWVLHHNQPEFSRVDLGPWTAETVTGVWVHFCGLYSSLMRPTALRQLFSP